MSNAAKHRKKAAEFEQLKQIDRAIASYVRAIEESEAEGEDVDVAVLNKVGDLALRQGRVPDAVTYYERAVEHYATSGLFNNAIALCNKILRNAPGRSNVYFTLGRICARKGLRGDATRNFLEYAARMKEESRVEEAMRALAEVADLMPELTEVRRLVDEHAERAGVAVPRRRTPLGVEALPPAEPRGYASDKSSDLVFLEVDYGAAKSRRAATPPVPAEAAVEAARKLPGDTLDGLEIADPDTDASGDENAWVESLDVVEPFAPPGPDDLSGARDETDLGSLPMLAIEFLDLEPFEFTSDEPASLELVLDVAEGLRAGDDRSPDEPVGGSATALDGNTPSTASPQREWIETDQLEPLKATPVGVEYYGLGVIRATPARHHSLAIPAIEAAIEAGVKVVAQREAETGEPTRRPPYRLDPHDFILPGELPPLIVDDDLLQDLPSALVGVGTSESFAAPASAAPSDAIESEPAADIVGAIADDTDLPSALTVQQAVRLTPALPIAAVAAVANEVAASRRDELRVAVSAAPQDWTLRRRLAEALFEAGQRDAALAELEASLSGFVQVGQLSAAADVSEELVRVSPDRVPYHQKRVELAVRLKDQQRLRFAYLDLADTLVRSAEEGRAQAVYIRVLEIDPYDERARTALGPAAPPLPTPVAAPEDSSGFVNLSDWLREDVQPASTRMRMPEPVVSGDEQADFAALLRHFKEGVSRSLGDEDFESRYDLGVAFKEMGLLDDAIAEFQKALRSRTHRLPAYEALGQCFVEQGRFQIAATVLARALHEPGLSDEQRVGVLYLLAYSCEALQRWGEARSYFQRVYATDINFRDVAARLAALELLAI